MQSLLLGSLGFDIWVDTLCILQDSPADKAFQITVMGNIFKIAILLIAAVRAGALTGFLGPARPVEPY